MTCGGYGPVIRFEGLDEHHPRNGLPPPPTSAQCIIQADSKTFQRLETESWLLGYRSLENSKKIENQWRGFVNDIVQGGWLDGFPEYAFEYNRLQVAILQAVFRYGRANIPKVRAITLVLAHRAQADRFSSETETGVRHRDSLRHRCTHHHTRTAFHLGNSSLLRIIHSSRTRY